MSVALVLASMTSPRNKLGPCLARGHSCRCRRSWEQLGWIGRVKTKGGGIMGDGLRMWSPYGRRGLIGNVGAPHAASADTGDGMAPRWWATRMRRRADTGGHGLAMVGDGVAGYGRGMASPLLCGLAPTLCTGNMMSERRTGQIELDLVSPEEPAPEPERSTVAPILEETCIEVNGLSLFYGQVQALKDIQLDIAKRRVTAFIGPSGCGKSSLLRCFNRLNDLIDDARTSGEIRLRGVDIRDPSLDVSELRRRVGMVFQQPNPFPKSIAENVAYGLRLHESLPKSELDDRVEGALRSAALWDEVKDRLQESALELSGGQQQRLVIARAIAVEPEVLLLDEPASALDPISTLRIEELIHHLKSLYTVVIVTHNMQQAARVSDYTAFLYLGELIEYGVTETVYTNPQEQRTEDYITGRYG